MMRKMLDEMKAEKQELVGKREELKKTYKEMDDMNPSKNYTLLKIRKIEEDLQAQYFKLLEESGEGSVGKAKAPMIKSKEYQEEKFIVEERERRRVKEQEEMKLESSRIERLQQ